MNNTKNELMSIDIQQLVRDGQESEVPISTPEEIDDQWSYFLSIVKQYRKKSLKKNRKRAIQIENDILNVIDACDLKGSSMTNIINSVLYTFIKYHKEELKSILKPSPTLILE